MGSQGIVLRITVMMLVASLTLGDPGPDQATWVGISDLGQELRRRAESAVPERRVSVAPSAGGAQARVVTRRGQISPDSRLWGLQTLDTDHTQSSVVSAQ